MPSSVIKFYHYNSSTLVLKIGFISGKVYDYIDVPEKTFKLFTGAISKGKFLNYHIKDKFEFDEKE